MRLVREMPLYRFAASFVIVLGLWQLSMGAAVMWIERATNPPLDAEGMSASFLTAAVGAILTAFGTLLLFRMRWSRIFTIQWLLFYALMFGLPWDLFLGGAPPNPDLARTVAVRVGGALTWLVPVMLVILLMNNHVRAEFEAPASAKAETPGEDGGSL